jgi:tetratricopeptide (TPR) repeat protein
LGSIPGVAHHALDGLWQPDALDFFQDAGIEGDKRAMLEFAEQFDRHSLLLKVVCGEIAKYPRHPYNFDAWRADPFYGGKLKLADLDLKQRYNHILRFALEGLDEPTRKLLCRISLFSESVTGDTLSVLNPFLPPKPAIVKEPEHPEQAWDWRWRSDDEKQTGIADHKRAQVAYRQYQEALRAYLESVEYEQAIRSFDKGLRELQDRGLLQWDRDGGHYDMHPVVRGHAAEMLDEGDRKQTFLAARDHFAALPPDDFDTATELSHVTQSIEIYRCLLGAGLFEEAVRFYRGDFSRALLFHIGAPATVIELLTPLFRGGENGLPNLESVDGQDFILNSLAIAVGELGRHDEALRLARRSLAVNVQEGDWDQIVDGLIRWAAWTGGLERRAESAIATALGLELAGLATTELARA